MPREQCKDEPPVFYSRLRYTALVDLAQNPSQLAMIRAAAGHPDVVQGIITGDRADMALANVRAANNAYDRGETSRNSSAGSTSFTRGKIYRHKPSGMKVTIIRAAASRKEGEVQHEVVCAKTGKKFLARQSNLRPLALGATD